jgi:hypothetical protein
MIMLSTTLLVPLDAGEVAEEAGVEVRFLLACIIEDVSNAVTF